MSNLIETKTFKQNFLSHSRWQNGLFWTFLYILLCLIFSRMQWSGYFESSATKALTYEAGQWWRLWSSALVHGDLKHLLNNSVMLVIMGYFVSSHYSPLIHPFGSLFIGGIINAIVLYYYPEHVKLVGASGVVHFLWGFWLVLYLFIQRHLKLSRRIMKITIVGMVVLIPSEFHANVSYLAHFVGLASGIVLGLFWWVMRKSYFQAFEKYEVKTEFEPDFADEAESAILDPN